jgi:nucleoid-associated protein YgaU
MSSMTSPVEAKLDARVRPQIVALQERTGYPRPRLVTNSPSAPEGERRGRRGRRERTPIRLTRRGRIVVGTAAVIGAAALAGLIWLVIGGQAQASSHAAPAGPWRDSVQRVVVRPGQTLWGIAVKVDPLADPRVVIPEIVELNSLRGTGLRIGQVLWVPRA